MYVARFIVRVTWGLQYKIWRFQHRLEHSVDWFLACHKNSIDINNIFMLILETGDVKTSWFWSIKIYVFIVVNWIRYVTS